MRDEDSSRIMRSPPCQLRLIVSQSRNISTYLYYHWKRRFKIEDSPVEIDSIAPQFRQIIKPLRFHVYKNELLEITLVEKL